MSIKGQGILDRLFEMEKRIVPLSIQQGEIDALTLREARQMIMDLEDLTRQLSRPTKGGAGR